jgi:hypothetical protein
MLLVWGIPTVAQSIKPVDQASCVCQPRATSITLHTLNHGKCQRHRREPRQRHANANSRAYRFQWPRSDKDTPHVGKLLPLVMYPHKKKATTHNNRTHQQLATKIRTVLNLVGLFVFSNLARYVDPCSQTQKQNKKQRPTHARNSCLDVCDIYIYIYYMYVN